MAPIARCIALTLTIVVPSASAAEQRPLEAGFKGGAVLPRNSSGIGLATELDGGVFLTRKVSVHGGLWDTRANLVFDPASSEGVSLTGNVRQTKRMVDGKVMFTQPRIGGFSLSAHAFAAFGVASLSARGATTREFRGSRSTIPFEVDWFSPVARFGGGVSWLPRDTSNYGLRVEAFRSFFLAETPVPTVRQQWRQQNVVHLQFGLFFYIRR